MTHRVLSKIFHLVLASGLATAAFAQDQGGKITPSAQAQVNILREDKVGRAAWERKLDTELLFAIKRIRGDAFLEKLPDLRTGRKLAESGIADVEIKGTSLASLAVAVAAVGTVKETQAERSILRARLPVGQIAAIAQRPDVRRIRRDLGYEVRKDNTSEGDVAHRADVTRSFLAVDGTGVKVGVLSDGIDTLAARQATGDLPATVNVIAGQEGEGDEGTAMLEIVHDLAPGADLYFATALDSEAQFAANIAALQAAGCSIIVDDVFYFAEGTFQDDVIAQAVNTFTAAGGLYFSSAGNSGNLNDGTSGVWEGDFVDAVTDPAALAGDDTHNFGAGSMNQIAVDSPSFFILQWSDPLLASDNDYDLYLLNEAGTSVFDAGDGFQDGTQDPFEFIDSIAFNDTSLQLAIVRFAGASRFLWLNANRGEFVQAHERPASGHSRDGRRLRRSGHRLVLRPPERTEPACRSTAPSPWRTSARTVRGACSSNRNGTPITPGNFLATRRRRSETSQRSPPQTACPCAAPGLQPVFRHLGSGPARRGHHRPPARERRADPGRSRATPLDDLTGHRGRRLRPRLRSRHHQRVQRRPHHAAQRPGWQSA